MIGIPVGLWLINNHVMPLDMLLERVMDKLPFGSAGLILPLDHSHSQLG